MKTKLPLLVIAALALLLPLTLSVISQQQVMKQYAATNHQVVIQNFTMNPKSLTVSVGDTVTWTNQDSDAHDVHSTQEAFRSPLLNKGQSWDFTFTQPGTFEYYCTPHKGSMNGYTVIVQPAAAAPPAKPPTAVPTQVPPQVQIPIVAPTTAPAQTVQIPQQNPAAQPGSSAKLAASIVLLLDGIGAAGDHTNTQDNSLSNKNPQSTQLPLAFLIINNAGQIIGQPTGAVTYTPASGDYRGTIELGSDIPPGVYTIKVKMLKYLMKTLMTGVTISASGISPMPPEILTTGDIDNNNVLDVKDYNSLLTCMEKTNQPSTCQGTERQLVDLNDDGSINLQDINLFLREFPVGKGD